MNVFLIKQGYTIHNEDYIFTGTFHNTMTVEKEVAIS